MKQIGISPKLVAAVLAAVVTYVIGQEVVDIPDWVVLVGQAVLVAVAAWVAPPGNVAPAPVQPGQPPTP